jgi:hypothetical protein
LDHVDHVVVEHRPGLFRHNLEHGLRMRAAAILDGNNAPVRAGYVVGAHPEG